MDVYVYNEQDELVGSVIHGEVWCGGELTVMAEGSAKTVWLYEGTNYRLELEGTDTGTMDVISRVLDKDGNVTRTTSYDALPLSANTVYQIEPDADTPVQTEQDEPVTPTQDTETGSQTYTLTVCSGVAELDGTTGAVLPVQAGQIVTVTAWIPNGYAFEGWTAETGVLGDTSQPVTTFRMPEGEVVVTAALRSEPSQPERVTVAPETVKLSVGDTRTLSASVTPAGTGGAITWASTDPEVAVVQENGQVTAMGQGTASIVAATEPGPSDRRLSGDRDSGGTAWDRNRRRFDGRRLRPEWGGRWRPRTGRRPGNGVYRRAGGRVVYRSGFLCGGTGPDERHGRRKVPPHGDGGPRHAGDDFVPAGRGARRIRHSWLPGCGGRRVVCRRSELGGRPGNRSGVC